jgi:hypothetical protein
MPHGGITNANGGTHAKFFLLLTLDQGPRHLKNKNNNNNNSNNKNNNK